ncbi:HNH endonuclease [Arcobacter roscoffensis]|uniref:HNH endonuclease n=1 Tax=Arcobacter roscoffensis TaxID=2961520 RepID=A0ABY5E4S5_9BACT|nr:HNH endonuclease [Arcobacter roscoffensis]UTJ05756.1 HNH endonuclease [Arcobacter roscoffensis]
MILDIKFIVLSSLLIAAIIPLYIYREKVFAFAYRKGDIEPFLDLVKNHMKKEHPLVPINYAIVEKTADEKDIRVRETIIVEDIVSQYFNYEYEKQTQGSVSKDKLWTGYDEKSVHNVKMPSDWVQRKELAWARDNQKCNRCAKTVSLKNSISIFVKDIEDGAGYNIENIITLCEDCNRVLNSKNPRNTMANLELMDRLMKYVES